MGGLGVAAVLGLGADAFLDKRRTVRELGALQVAVQVARDSVTLCQSELGIQEASFRVFDLQADSLRQAEARCRELVIDHNVSVESLRARVEAEGLSAP